MPDKIENILSTRISDNPIDNPTIDLLVTFGFFTLEFSRFEDELYQLFRKLTGVREDAAQIVFAYLKSGAIANYLPALIDLSDLPSEAKRRLKKIVSQFQVIAEMRNDLSHQFNYLDGETGDAFHSMDMRRKSAPLAHATATKYDIESLRNAQMDLQTMWAEVTWIILSIPGTVPHVPPRPYQKNQYTSESWHYRRPSPPRLPKQSIPPQISDKSQK